MEKLLDNRGIYAIYAQMMNRIMPKRGNAVRSKKLLQLVLAAARPLSLGELDVALNISLEHHSFEKLGFNMKARSKIASRA